MDTKLLKQLPALLLPWYEKNRRDLPWRADKEPYHIWLSEIMLQQTRVEAVKGYYSRFLEALPTIEALAAAPQDQINKLWEGLGYYSRVRNLQKAARVIMEEYNGCFPRSFAQVIALPGIGPYTAGAICSIAYDLPTPAVDGNVLRVLARILADYTPVDSLLAKQQAQQQLEQVYPERAGDFTQALMELGATVCGPNQKPDCKDCPCKEICKAHRLGIAEKLPVRSPKKERRQEDKTVFLLEAEGMIAVERRPEEGLLAGLWQFPNTPGHLDTEAAIAYLEKLGIGVADVERMTEKKHIFTHVQWNMRAYYLRLKQSGGPYIWLPKEQVEEKIPLPTAFRIFWE